MLNEKALEKGSRRFLGIPLPPLKDGSGSTEKGDLTGVECLTRQEMRR